MLRLALAFIDDRFSGSERGALVILAGYTFGN